ncbi:hypothetical protein [Rhodoferax antarcticus]|uniref:hypothetical protein n=1 Tax=Rhodoferax antarcticus TaxID=81479 RepID=UPI000957D5A8|nr:hypothetical protein [Rhodoferax antarcticus]APW47595.1 hypothetical protein RA876_15955 [Rhodoferax antarcticus]
MPRRTKATAKPKPNATPNTLTLVLPEEFLALCASDGVTPELVLRGFIADLCQIMSWAAEPRTDGYCSNGSDERSMAMEYYQRVGYPWWNKP